MLQAILLRMKPCYILYNVGLYGLVYTVVTARRSDGSIVFSIIAKFFPVTTITHEPLHLP